MKILFCIKGMNNPGGGAERVLSLVASGLAERGHEISLLSFDRPGGQSFFPLNTRIQRIELGIGSTVDRATFQTTVRRTIAMRRAARYLAPDVAVGFMHSTYISLGLALLGTGIPVIASEHIVGEHYSTRPLEALLLRTAPYTAAQMISVSEQARDSFPPSIARNMVPIENPISAATGRADVLGSGSSRKTLLTVGRLDPQKDQEILIDAFADIANQFPDWDLRIVGEGEMRQRLEAKISSLDMHSRIFLPGAVKDISAEYTAAQLFVLPSRYESLGLTTAEALGYGLPAIGFADCPGTNVLIRPGVNGELVQATEKRSAALAAKLQALMADDARRQRFAENAVKSINGHELSTILDEWESVIRSVRANSAGAPYNARTA